MTRVQDEAIKKLRDLGYAITIFTPGEVGELSADRLESVMVDRGWDFISSESEESDSCLCCKQ
jgi:hypothetical protein